MSLRSPPVFPGSTRSGGQRSYRADLLSWAVARRIIGGKGMDTPGGDMFDLFKDLDKYRGITPYSSELYGVYQPLLGWSSGLTKKWLQKGGPIADPRIRRILNGWITPGPDEVRGS